MNSLWAHVAFGFQDEESKLNRVWTLYDKPLGVRSGTFWCDRSNFATVGLDELEHPDRVIETLLAMLPLSTLPFLGGVGGVYGSTALRAQSCPFPLLIRDGTWRRI